MSIFAGTNGFLDDIPVVRRAAASRPSCSTTCARRHADLMTTIRDTGALPDGDALATAVADFKAARSSRPSRASVRRADAATDASDRSERAVAPRPSRSGVAHSMAGGQERILRRRIKSVAVDEEDHARRWS